MKVAELFETNDIGSRVRRSLKNAIDNGYGDDFKKMSAEEIAADLQRFDSDLEKHDVKDIVPHVKTWLKVNESAGSSDKEVIADLKRALERAPEGRHADFCDDGPNEISVRYWGHWESEHSSRDWDEEEDEDDDWEVPTAATRRAVDAIVREVEKRHKRKINVSTGEKNYYYFNVLK